MASTIGIKLANGEFYPVLMENSQEKKRLVLTTVYDKQRSIQIDLYRSPSRTMIDALYIGSLVMEKIKPLPKGEPSIELVITSSENGDINADMVNLDAGTKGRQTLNVSLKSLDEAKQDYIISDLDLENELAPPTGLYEPVGEVKVKKSWLPKVILIAVILLVIIFAIWLLLFLYKGEVNFVSRVRQLFQRSQSQTSEQPQIPAVSQQTAPQGVTSPAQPPSLEVTQQETPPVPASQPVLIEAPAQPPVSVQVNRNRPPAPVSSYNVPSVIPREGVLYRIRYGDTLWDISEAFYRNPWLYPRIARFNNIRNPDLIISGTTIRVPPRN